jgi:hypothetical protein
VFERGFVLAVVQPPVDVRKRYLVARFASSLCSLAICISVWQVVVMKTFYALPAWLLAWLLLAALVMLSAGCASTPKPDWDKRVGNFTFDDAVKELGPPVASTQLQDGTTVAEWFLKAGAQMSFGFGMSSYGGGGGAVGVGHSVTAPPKGHFLRLTFGPDGKLQRWEKFKR